DAMIAYYDRCARAFWDGTRHHDVSQNYTAFLGAIEGDPPYSILDLGCGPGRDLSHFRSLGHEALGLDGSQQFVAMARTYSQCEVLHQDFLTMQLPESRFDGVFANASLFHVPSQELPRVLLELCKTLKPRGVLFSSNTRGNNEDGLSDDLYALFFYLDSLFSSRRRHTRSLRDWSSDVCSSDLGQRFGLFAHLLADKIDFAFAGVKCG